MQVENSFSVEAPIDRVWAYLLDVQAVAPCVPGAELTEVVSETEYKGTVKVKLGAVQMSYRGTLVLKEVDNDAHRVVLTATGSETRGTGGASGTVTSTATADGPTRTTINMVSEITVTGKVAQFGRNIMQDVSNRLIKDFARCLEANLNADGEDVRGQGGQESGGQGGQESGGQGGQESGGLGGQESGGQGGQESGGQESGSQVGGDEGNSGGAASAETMAHSESFTPAGSGLSSSTTGVGTEESSQPRIEQPGASKEAPRQQAAPAEIKVLPIVLDVTRARAAKGLRRLAHFMDPERNKE